MKRLLFLIFAFIFLVALFGIWFIYGMTPPSSQKTSKRFVIDQGEVAAQIGKDLAKENIIRSALAFRIYSQVTQTARVIKPGSYELPTDEWVPQIVSKLLAGPSEVWVTVPEGLRREEILAKFVDGFELSGKNSDNFSNQFLNLTSNKEGYLFPDTYLFPKDASAGAVVRVLENNFETKYAAASKTRTNNLSREQIVTLASIVQREAITAEDMQGVASVLMNRYNEGMSLGSDVTLEYAVGYDNTEKTWWKKDLTVDDLALNSPYNTRLNVGFPPTPISNPGLVALEAAMNPPHTDYLYYLSDSDGKLHFARTLTEHNANIQKYLQ